MLEALHADGFSITGRQLRRVRTENQMLFRASAGSNTETDTTEAEELQRELPDTVDSRLEAILPPAELAMSNLLDDEAAFAQALQAESNPWTEVQQTLAEEIYAGTLSHLQRANWADDIAPESNFHGMCFIELADRTNVDEVADARKIQASLPSTNDLQVERTAQPGDAIDLTAPAQPTRRSDLSVDDCKSVLNVDDDAYWKIRDSFKGICTEIGIQEKKFAFELWDVAITRLIEENVHLHGIRSVDVGTTEADAERHKLQVSALDKICTLAAKSMRECGPRVHLSDARTILGLNPNTSREVMQSFESFLKHEYKMTSKSKLKEEQRKGLMVKWILSSPWLQKLLKSLDPDPAQAQHEYEGRLWALECLCRDMLKKLRSTATKQVKEEARLRASPSSNTDDAPGQTVRRRSTRRARTRINSQTPSSASLHSYSAEDLSLLDDLNSLSPEDMNLFTPDGSTAFNSRHASPYSTSDLNLLSTTGSPVDLSPVVPDEDNIIDDEWYKSLQEQLNMDIQQHAAKDQLSVGTLPQVQGESHGMDESCFDNLPDELNLDFAEDVAPGLDAAIETQEQDMSKGLIEVCHNNPPDDMDLNFAELVAQTFDEAVETRQPDVNTDMDGAWYSSLQDQLHEDLHESTGNGRSSAKAQNQDDEHPLVPEQTVDTVNDRSE